MGNKTHVLMAMIIRLLIIMIVETRWKGRVDLLQESQWLELIKTMDHFAAAVIEEEK